MRGSITRRGKSSWRIKFELPPIDGKRRYHLETVNGTKPQAQATLAKRIVELGENRYVPLTAETVETYAKHWLENIAPASRAESSVHRYSSIINHHIIPALGAIELQKLDGTAIDKFYGSLTGASMTRRSIHAVLRMVLGSAVKAKKIARSPIADVQTTPKGGRRDEIEVLDEAELAALLDHLRGHWLYVPSLTAASTGLRRGEVLGLRWQDINMTAGTIEIAQTVVEIGARITIAPPKTRRSRRTIKVPAALIVELERHRREQLEQRLKVGLGGRPELVFTNPTGQPITPKQLSEGFTAKAAAIKPVTFHCLRHTHITHLLKAGVPVHIVSARAGHAKPSITLDAYSHLLGGEDNDAAKQAEAILGRVLR